MGILAKDVPTVVPVSPFDAVVDARSLYNAIAGWGTNEATIIKTLCYRTFAQRYEIAQNYFTLYGHVTRAAFTLFDARKFHSGTVFIGRLWKVI